MKRIGSIGKLYHANDDLISTFSHFQHVFPCEMIDSLWLNLTDDKSTPIQVIACCLTAPGHYLNQCWPRYRSLYGATRPQCVKPSAIKLKQYIYNGFPHRVRPCGYGYSTSQVCIQPKQTTLQYIQLKPWVNIYFSRPSCSGISYISASISFNGKFLSGSDWGSQFQRQFQLWYAKPGLPCRPSCTIGCRISNTRVFKLPGFVHYGSYHWKHPARQTGGQQSLRHLLRYQDWSHAHWPCNSLSATGLNSGHSALHMALTPCRNRPWTPVLHIIKVT